MTYILKWNPDISSINLTEWEYWIQHFPFIKPNWSVYEHENSEYGDEFYLVKVGSGKTGVVMKGIFSSLPYRAQDWSGKGRKVFYRDLRIAHIMHPDKGPIIPISALNDAIPDFDWEKGHSGICLNEYDTTEMEKLWNEFAKKNADFLQKQDMSLSRLHWRKSKEANFGKRKFAPNMQGQMTSIRNAPLTIVST